MVDSSEDRPIAFSRRPGMKGSLIIFFITFLVALDWFLFIIELGVTRKRQNDAGPYGSSWYYRSDLVWEFGVLYDGMNWAAILFAQRSFALITDAVHLLIYYICSHWKCFHPRRALCLSIFMVALWTAQVALNVKRLYPEWYDENTNYQEHDYGIVWDMFVGSSAVSFVIALSYVCYLAYAAHAAHMWRLEKGRTQDVPMEDSHGVLMDSLEYAPPHRSHSMDDDTAPPPYTKP